VVAGCSFRSKKPQSVMANCKSQIVNLQFAI
jgi:hypothetical protein